MGSPCPCLGRACAWHAQCKAAFSLSRARTLLQPTMCVYGTTKRAANFDVIPQGTGGGWHGSVRVSWFKGEWAGEERKGRNSLLSLSLSSLIREPTSDLFPNLCCVPSRLSSWERGIFFFCPHPHSCILLPPSLFSRATPRGGGNGCMAAGFAATGKRNGFPRGRSGNRGRGGARWL